MSRTVDCPACGRPMDIPAYPGDGVYRTHVCSEELEEKGQLTLFNHKRRRAGESEPGLFER